MVTLQELFRRLSLGELSNLSMSNNGTGEIKSSAKAQIVLHANDALEKLFTRFIIRERQLILETNTHTTNYELTAAHALTQVSEDNPEECYIIDGPHDPFTGDVIKVLEAQSSLHGDMVINEVDNPLSLFTPRHDLLQVPYPIAGQIFSIKYQAKHPQLVVEEESQIIDLPSYLLPALRSYIAFCVYAQKNTAESALAAKRHFDLYEVTCQEVEAKGLLSTTRTIVFHKFEKNGWV